MSHSYDVWADSPATVEQIHAAYGREDDWLARFAAGDTTATLDSLTVDGGDTVTMNATQYLGRTLLPERVGALLPGDLKIITHETWRPSADGQLHGKVSAGIIRAMAGSGAVVTAAGPCSRRPWPPSCLPTYGSSVRSERRSRSAYCSTH